MKERRKKIMKRLVIEELERRSMLSAVAPTIVMNASALTDNSLEDFYKSVVGTEIGGAAGIGMVDQDIGPHDLFRTFVHLDDDLESDMEDAYATTGLGLVTTTTGANTLGIGSFASPTAGPSRSGGTGNPALPGLGGAVAKATDGATDAANGAMTDAAIESLFADMEDKSADESASAQGADQAEPAQLSERVLATDAIGRRAFDIDPEEAEAAEAKEEPVGAGH